MFIIAGCKEGAVGGPITKKNNGVLCNTNNDCLSGSCFGPANGAKYCQILPVAGVTETKQLSCSSTKDEFCPSSCAAGTDYDCCINKGAYWTVSDQGIEGCFDTLYSGVQPLGNDRYMFPSGKYLIKDGLIITLVKVGSGGDVAVDVDGTSQIIAYQQTVTVLGGLQITNLDQFYDSKDQSFSSAILSTKLTPLKGPTQPTQTCATYTSQDVCGRNNCVWDVGSNRCDTKVVREPASISNTVCSKLSITACNTQYTRCKVINSVCVDLLVKSSTGVEITGSVTEDVPMGINIASPNQFNNILTKNDIESLSMDQINFAGKSYRTSEKLILNLNKNVSLQTSLTSSDDDYNSVVRMEVEKSALTYLYSFDDSIPSGIYPPNPLQIKFLGKDFKILSINSPTSITVDTGNGPKSVKDGSSYFGDDGICNNDPNDLDCWKWIVKNMNNVGTSTTFNNTVANGIIWWNGPVLAVTNDFALNDYKDNPLTVGDCLSLPSNYITLCFDGLTTNDADNLKLTFEKDEGFSSKAAEAGVSRPIGDAALLISSNVPNSLVMDVSSQYFQSKMIADNFTMTNQIWVGAFNDSVMAIYFEDQSGTTKLAGLLGRKPYITQPSTRRFGDEDQVFDTIAYLNYGRLKDSTATGTGVRIDALIVGVNSSLELAVQPYDPELWSTGGVTVWPTYPDTIWMNWSFNGKPTGALSGLGTRASSEEFNELRWESVPIGTKDEDHRTKFGIIIKNPKSGGSSDKVVLEIPNDLMQGNIVIKK